MIPQHETRNDAGWKGSMMISRKRGVLAALTGAAALAVALSGCTSSASTTNSASGPTLAVYNGASGAFVKNFNPLSPTVLSNIQGLIYEPMFFYNNLATLATKPKPLLGQSFSFNADGTVLSVTLKSGVKWSDGKPITASDVAFTMNLIRTTPALNTSGNTSLLNGGRELRSAAGVPQTVAGLAQETRADVFVWLSFGV
jgi:peptide/nickel transport system substrate-binding protein